MLANLVALPLIASGHLTGGVKPVVAFDRLCHASLAYHKPVVAAETEVVTVDHNDLSALERLCEAKGCVARSEEHTSELQSLMRISYAVFCLKKKNKNT